MRQVLFSWVGAQDVRLSRQDKAGALASTLAEPRLGITGAVLLRDPQEDGGELYTRESLDQYTEWLRMRSGVPIQAVDAPLPNPMHFGAIYEQVRKALERHASGDVAPTFNLSSGTSAMAAVWILLGRGTHPARLTNSSMEAGVVVAEVPFDLHADFLPELKRASDRRLVDLGAGEARGSFGQLQFRSQAMRQVVARARKVARFDVPVLIQGESGTGKELLAQAIHLESPRRAKQFQAVNCGAIPSELLESTLFGHRKGAFTSAERDHAGLFESADGGTLFLDEIGDLPLVAQVKLLRVLQEGEVVRVGDTKRRTVNVRVVAASHKDLQGMVQEGSFREDLFYRLAVAVLRIPPLRERGEDLQLLIDVFLDAANGVGRKHAGYREKTLTVAARRKLVAHPWPGNVRELQNTLTRAAIWSDRARIGPDDVEFVEARAAGDGILDRPLHDGFDIKAVTNEVERHYLSRALEAGGTKAKAAELLGINRQSVSDWSKRLGLADE